MVIVNIILMVMVIIVILTSILLISGLYHDPLDQWMAFIILFISGCLFTLQLLSRTAQFSSLPLFHTFTLLHFHIITFSSIHTLTFLLFNAFTYSHFNTFAL